MYSAVHHINVPHHGAMTLNEWRDIQSNKYYRKMKALNVVVQPCQVVNIGGGNYFDYMAKHKTCYSQSKVH